MLVSLIKELKRRRVFKVVASYAVVAWLLIQIIVAVEGPLALPDGSDTFVIIALLIGFPIIVILAWIYDCSAGGIERTADLDDAAGVHAAPLSHADKWTVAVAVSAAILLAGTGTYLLVDNLGQSIDTIAITAFEHVETDGSMPYLGEGMRDSLITRLSRLQGIRIKSTGTAINEATELEALGALLDVDAIGTGRVSQHADAIEVVAELIDADDGSILWRDTYTSRASSLLDIEREVSVEIARRLGRELTAAEQAGMARHDTENPAAHRLYLEGRYYWNRRTDAGFMRSIELYNRATMLDPNYALAYAGLADTYLMMLGWGIREPDAVAPDVVEAAQRAILLDPTLAEPHAALGYLRTMYDRDWDGAREEFFRAIELNSNYSSAHHWYAFLLLTEGKHKAAIDEILLARELEPLSPIINAEVGYFFMFDRQYERALEELEAASLLDPSYPSTVRLLVRVNAMLGRREQALQLVERWRDVAGDGLITNAFGATNLPLIGLEEEAREIYERLHARSRETYIMQSVLGRLAAALGDHDTAFEHFEAALEEGSLVVSWLRDPLLDDIREDPRFADLLERVGLEPS